MKKRVTITPRPAKPATPDEWVSGQPAADQEEATRGRLKRLTLDIDAELHRAIKLEATRQGKTIVEMLRELLAQRYGKTD
jgi:predicted HicB family RNase H-like nuclease